MKDKSKKSTYSTTFGVDPRRMRSETMKDKSKKSTYSTTFGVDPYFIGEGALKCANTKKGLRKCESLKEAPRCRIELHFKD